MNKSSSPLFHLHLHLLHFFDNEQIFIFQKKKKKRDKIFKKGLGTRGIRLVFLRFLSKKKNFKIFNSMKKFKIYKIFKKEKKKRGNFQKRPQDQGHWARTSQVAFKKKKKKIINQNFQFLEKIQDFQIFQKKKKSK